VGTPVTYNSTHCPPPPPPNEKWDINASDSNSDGVEDTVAVDTGDYTVTADSNGTVKIFDESGNDVTSQCQVEVSGDPHVYDESGHVADTHGTTTVVCPDGTKVTMQTTPAGNGTTFVESVLVSDGNNAVVMNGVAPGGEAISYEATSTQGQDWDESWGDGLTMYLGTDGELYTPQGDQMSQQYVNGFEDGTPYDESQGSQAEIDSEGSDPIHSSAVNSSSDETGNTNTNNPSTPPANGSVDNVENYENYTIAGTSGNDRIEIKESGSGDGVDVFVNGELKAENVPHDELANILIDGGGGNDTIINRTNAEAKINGGAGNDRITGGSGNDTINAGDGNDTVNGRGGDDTVNAGAGDDRVNGGNGNDTLWGNAGTDTINGGNGNDTLGGVLGEGNVINGGDGDDKIVTGGNSSNTIDGGSGEDSIVDDMALQMMEEEQGSSKKKGKAGSSSGSGIWGVIAAMGEKVDAQLKNVMDAIDKVDTSAENNVTAKQLSKVQVQTAKLGWFGQTWQTVGQTAAQTGEKAGSAGKPS
jgi:Ca2+-binding RTX toxin-like protein